MKKLGKRLGIRLGKIWKNTGGKLRKDLIRLRRLKNTWKVWNTTLKKTKRLAKRLRKILR